MANDHYVPQFYLRSFEIAKKKKWIWVYGRNVRPGDIAIKSVACEDDFYTLKSEIPGIDRGMVDKILKVMENGAAPLLKYLSTAKECDLQGDDKLVVSIFIALLANRNPYFLEKIKNLHSEVNKQVTKILAANKELWDSRMNEVGENLEDAEETRQFVLSEAFDNEINVVPANTDAEDYMLLQAIDLADRIAPIIYDKHWLLVESATSRVFVTSDNPVMLVPPEGLHPSLGVGWVNAHAFLPISPTRGLFMSAMKPKHSIALIKREGVSAFNNEMIFNAHKNVFANLKSGDFETVFNKTQQGHNTRITSDQLIRSI